MDSSGDLDIAIRKGNAQRVREILQQNNVNLRARENDDLLWMAIRKGNTEIVEMLIRAGADLNVKDPHDYKNQNYGYSILHELFHLGENDVNYRRLALLAIEHGADVNAIDDYGNNVFQFIYVPLSVKLMKALISRGINVDREYINEYIETAAHGENAAKTLPLIFSLNDPSTREISKRAITANIDLLSSEYYSLRLFKENLKLVVDINEIPLNDTMLTMAASEGRVDAAMVLLNRGADINKKNDDGYLPLYYASASEVCIITKLLISRGASIHARNGNGEYPIHGACFSKRVDNLHYLLSLGASLDVTDREGRYPIHNACLRKRKQVIYFLLILGTPINVIDFKGKTPFYQLSRENLRPTIFLFMKYFVLVHVTTGAVRGSDLRIIQANPQMSQFYEKCYNELQSMSQTVIFEDFDLLTLLVTSTPKLTVYWRNTAFAAAMEDCLEQQSARFPIYIEQLAITFRVARIKCEFIENMENILAQSFPVAVPYLVIEKITRYIVSQELIRLKLDFYLSLYKQVVPSDWMVLLPDY